VSSRLGVVDVGHHGGGIGPCARMGEFVWVGVVVVVVVHWRLFGLTLHWVGWPTGCSPWDGFAVGSVGHHHGRHDGRGVVGVSSV
jgi:hypothetical protein